uniref:Uncharacterized protein n=1 Tax=Salix viminalis TaxID=40686 RepID=A0A6N2LJ77_SALVM
MRDCGGFLRQRGGKGEELRRGKSEPAVPKAELSKKEESATKKLTLPKVDYATELFNVLCMDDSRESDSTNPAHDKDGPVSKQGLAMDPTPFVPNHIDPVRWHSLTCSGWGSHGYQVPGMAMPITDPQKYMQVPRCVENGGWYSMAVASFHRQTSMGFSDDDCDDGNSVKQLIIIIVVVVVVVLRQALPNQQTVDYPSFKLVIVGDGGTEMPLAEKALLLESIN